jgi:hypothetical protein
MVQERTGPRWDNRAWPPAGGEIYVEDEEGAAICGAGWAVPVPEQRKTETPEDTLNVATETRTAESPAEPVSEPAVPEPAPVPAVPAVNDPKGAWVDHAVAQGASKDAAEAMSKSALIRQYGS